MNRSLRRALLWSGGLAALAVAAVGLWRALPWIAERIALRELSAAGVQVTALTVESISLDHVSVAKVALNEDSVRVDGIDVDYSLRDLPDLKIRRITVHGARITAAWKDGRFDFAPLEGFTGQGSGGAPPEIPAMLIGSDVVLDDAVATVTGLPGGPVTMPLSAEISVESASRVLAMIKASAETGAARLALRANADIDPATGAVSVAAQLDDGKVATPYGQVAGLSGAATLATAQGSIPSVELQLSARRMSSPLGGFAGAQLTASVDGTSAQAGLTLPGDDGRSRIVLTAKADNWAEDDVSFAVTSKVSGFSIATMPEVPKGPVTFGERPLAFAMTAKGRVRDPLTIDPANPATWIDRVTADGALDFDLPDIGVAPLLERATGHGDLHLSLARSVLTVETRSGVSLATEGVDVASFGYTLPPRIARRLENEIVFDLAPGPNPLLILRESGEGPVEAELDNLWRVSTTDGVTLAGSVRGSAAIDPDDGKISAWQVERAAFSLSGYDDAFQGLRLDQARIVVSGDSDALEGIWSVAGGGDLALGEGGAFDAVQAILSGGIAYADSTLRLQLGKDTKVMTGGGSIGGAVRVEPFAVTAAAADGPLVAVTRGEAGTTIRGGLVLRPSDVTGAVRPTEAGEAIPFTLSIPGVSLSATGALPGDGTDLRYDATVGVKGGALAMPTVQVAGSGIDLDMTVDRSAIDGVLTIAQLRQTRPPPIVAPVAVTAKTRLAGDSLTFDVRAEDKSGALVVDAKGTHDLSRGTGTGDITLYPLTFVADGGLQPVTVFPIASRHMSTTNGVVSAGGGVSWGPGGIDSDIELKIEDFSTLAGDIAIEGVNGVVTFDGLTPPSTLPDQVISVAGVTAGLPLTNGAIVGGMRDGLPYITETEWKWAGGTVSSTPIRITQDGQIEDFTLSLENIGLEALLNLTPEGDNIEATGTLNGKVPMSFRNGGFQVIEGRLETAGPGILRYKSEAFSGDFVASNQGLGLFLQAVENFAYDSIRIDLDGQSGDQIEIALHIDGKNPDLYGGTPFELNLSVSGRLDEIFRRSLETFRVPDAVRERIQELESR